MNKEKWVPVSVVADRLNVSSMTVRRLISKRELQGRRVGVSGCMQVLDSSVADFMQRRVDVE